MDLLLFIGFALAIFLFFIFCLFSFGRYLFRKNIGVLSYVVAFIYAAVVPITHTVFSVGAVTIVMKAYFGTVLFSWMIPVSCFIGVVLLAIIPENLILPSKGDSPKYWFFLVPIVLIVAGISIGIGGFWWNDQLSRTIHPSFPSIGTMMIVSNCFFIISLIVELFIGREKQLNVEEL